MRAFQQAPRTLVARGLAVVLAVLVAGSASAQFGKNKIRYEDFDWKIYHAPHFDVYYYDSEEHLLGKIVSYAESAYDELSQAFNYRIEEPTPLIIYETHADFEQTNIILNFIPEGIGAFASPVRNRMVLPIDLPGPELYELLLHELTHIFEYHMIFGANLSKGVTSSPPTWFMEGLASYMAHDEGAREQMYLRDAVVNDNIPPVTSDFGGFFAYRFGSAVFQFIEERWGKEGVRDFIIETRNTLGGRVGRAIERTFAIDAEDFDGDFRRWLRKKYLPELISTGEPGDFGRRFRQGTGPRSVQTSPVASPSGDLLVAFSTDGSAFSSPNSAQVDIVLYDTRQREVIRNLTKGFDDAEFQYFIAQELTMGRKMGRDLAFSPSGDRVAFFARRQKGRSLVLLDVLRGKIDKVLPMEVDQQIAPAWSPDGRHVAFGGHRNGQFDIWQVDVESGAVAKITDDEIFDAAPAYAPDGKSIVVTSVLGDHAKLFRIQLDNPGVRYPLTDGESNETDATYSPSGERIYFTSDRGGVNNIYSLELATGELRQHTNAVTGCYQPTVLAGEDGKERLVFAAFWRGRHDLYLLDPEDPVTDPLPVVATQDLEAGPVDVANFESFEPAIEVAIDERNKDKFGGRRFFVEDVGGTVGVSDDQTFVGTTYIQMSDFMGDRRILGVFQSVESFQNFDVIYSNLSNRWQWQVHLFDDRDFFIAVDESSGLFRRGRTAFSQTGVIGSVVYPWNVSHRFQIGAGYVMREFLAQVLRVDEEGNRFLTIDTVDDDFPLISTSVVGDTSVLSPWGTVGGRRWNLGYLWAPDLDDSGTLVERASLDFRQYLPLTKRSNLAFRAVGIATDGNTPSPVYFGGLDTVRGFDFRSIVGTHGFYTNLELRFPFFDQLSTPIVRFGGVRAILFLDIGGAWFDEFQTFRFADDEDRLVDAVSSYGYGFTVRFLGVDVNVDFAKRWDFKDSDDGFESSIWVGRRF